ncbi:hypothetical protein SteCoe_2236 [Stentor coeruleus]|uniref:Uncharacterized protein n=1 Tax=Stentor coeruleus TaxID=5963 RepID=A0A1R2D000_9CILI|nr:hypothetical protein SteCoe_2236 [Stentor coeruleus]
MSYIQRDFLQVILKFKNDEEKINFIKTMLCRIYGSHAKRRNSIIMNFSILSDDTSTRSFGCSQTQLKLIKKNRICNQHIDTDDQYHFIYENFMGIYKEHITCGSRLKSEKPEVFITHIKQFFYDKGLVTESYLRILMNVYKNEKWVDVKLFTESIEALQVNFFGTVYYFFVKPPTDTRIKLDNQKLVFFYNFINVQMKKSLSLAQLCEIYKTAFRGMKENEANSKVRELFNKLTLREKIHKHSMTLEELISILPS